MKQLMMRLEIQHTPAISSGDGMMKGEEQRKEGEHPHNRRSVQNNLKHTKSVLLHPRKLERSIVLIIGIRVPCHSSNSQLLPFSFCLLPLLSLRAIRSVVTLFATKIAGNICMGIVSRGSSAASLLHNSQSFAFNFCVVSCCRIRFLSSFFV